MKDITLITVNWNQKACLELLLKSYIHYHYIDGERLKIILLDNGSTDGSKEWLLYNNIPFISLSDNIWHEPALNIIYPIINTKYCILNDTDVEYKGNVYGYINRFNEEYKSAGEYINRDCFNEHKIKPRISPWFMIWDCESAKMKGINRWRVGDNWLYDVGSWYTEQMQQHGFKNYNIERLPGNQDEDVVSMQYPLYDHIGKVSWDLSKHHDRIDEVLRRREYVQQRLKEYEHIDLKNKFIYG